MGNAAEHQKKQMQMASASASADGDGDRLRSINDELRHNAGASSPWLPLESNPEVFTQFAHSVGLPSDWGWHDVYGLDDELLAMVPQNLASIPIHILERAARLLVQNFRFSIFNFQFSILSKSASFSTHGGATLFKWSQLAGGCRSKF